MRVTNDTMKTLIAVAPPWAGTTFTFIAIEQLNSWIALIAGVVTISYTLYKWVRDVQARKENKRNSKQRDLF